MFEQFVFIFLLIFLISVCVHASLDVNNGVEESTDSSIFIIMQVPDDWF